MHGKRARKGLPRAAALELAAAILLAGARLGTSALPAEAAFPGNSGRIVYLSNRITPGNAEGRFELFTMNPDGTLVQQLTKNNSIEIDPVWSPDGTRIVFVSKRDGNFEVYAMRADGADQTNRTSRGGRDDIEPNWQPRPGAVARWPLGRAAHRRPPRPIRHSSDDGPNGASTMRQTPTERGAHRGGAAALPAVLVLAGSRLGGTARPTEGALPGKNGRTVFTSKQATVRPGRRAGRGGRAAASWSSSSRSG